MEKVRKFRYTADNLSGGTTEGTVDAKDIESAARKIRGWYSPTRLGRLTIEEIA